MPFSNPYSAPSTITSDIEVDPWKPARRGIRISLAILLIPAVLNYVAWERWLVSTGWRQSQVDSTTSGIWAIRIANFVLLSIGFLILWYFALPVLKFCARLLVTLIRRKGEINDDWHNPLIAAMEKIPRYATAGAGVWIVWVIGFYLLEIRHFAFTAIFSTVGHILAATWYGPLVVQFGKTKAEDRDL